MADLDENLAVWKDWDWSQAGEEWSATWGGTPALWYGALLPRLHSFIPTETILEIAPGYGRWTDYLKDACERLVLVDMAENCIDACRERFSAASNIDFHTNDGRSLQMIADGSIDLAFSFDSLVHAEEDVLSGYLTQLAAKLRPDGVGFIHHSNAGAYRALSAITRRAPNRGKRRLVDSGLLLDVYAWRAESVTAERFAAACEAAGMVCISQEKITWEHGPWLTDAISVFTPRGSRWDRPRVVLSNRGFREQARRAARLYSAA
jgi:SAM-dependent methyltransferase